MRHTGREKSYETVLSGIRKKKMSMKSSELRTLTLDMPINEEGEEDDEEEDLGKEVT